MWREICAPGCRASHRSAHDAHDERLDGIQKTKKAAKSVPLAWPVVARVERSGSRWDRAPRAARGSGCVDRQKPGASDPAGDCQARAG